MEKLAIFDIDNTLVDGQSQQAFLEYIFKKRIIKPLPFFKIYLWFILYKIGIVKNPKKIMNYAFSFLKGWPIEKLSKIIESFFEEKLEKKFFKEGLELVKKHKSRGDKIILLSNAFDFLVARIARFLNADGYIGTKLEIENGTFTGKISGDIVYGGKKIDYIENFSRENNFSAADSWAYADHTSDLPFLKIVKYPVTVNPDRNLLKEAKKRKWPVLIFKKPKL